MIKSPRECKGIWIDPERLKFKLFVCREDKKELKGKAALEYIEWGESQGYNKVSSVAARRRWWDLGARRLPKIISPSSVSGLLRTFENTGVFADKRLYEIYPSTDDHAILLATNSTLCSLFLEVGSRTGLGEGLLDLTVYELADCPILVPEDHDRVEIVLAEARQRNFGDLYAEIKHPNRKALDDIIFDALGLTQGERDAVYEAVIDLVETRMNKASSLNQQEPQS